MGSTVPLTFWELVAQAAKEHPDVPVVSDDHGRSLTELSFETNRRPRPLRSRPEGSQATPWSRGSCQRRSKPWCSSSPWQGSAPSRTR